MFFFDPLTRMLIRLYRFPFGCLLTAAFLTVFITPASSEANNTRAMASIIDQLVSSGAYYGGLVCLSSFAIFFLYSSFRLWKWYSGDSDEVCHVCGGIVDQLEGRWGPYFKCLACGNNRSIR